MIFDVYHIYESIDTNEIQLILNMYAISNQ